MNLLRRSCVSALTALAFIVPSALAAAREVTAADANGTYRDGKSEIKILSVGAA